MGALLCLERSIIFGCWACPGYPFLASSRCQHAMGQALPGKRRYGCAEKHQKKKLLSQNGSGAPPSKKPEAPRLSKWEAILQKQPRNKKAELICQKCMIIIVTWATKSCCRSCSGSWGWWLEPAGLPPTGPVQPWSHLQKAHGAGSGAATVKTNEPATPVAPSTPPAGTEPPGAGELFKVLNSEGSPEGCSGWVDSEVVGLSVHAWSLTVVVESVVIATIVVIVVLLPLSITFSW